MVSNNFFHVQLSTVRSPNEMTALNAQDLGDRCLVETRDASDRVVDKKLYELKRHPSTRLANWEAIAGSGYTPGGGGAGPLEWSVEWGDVKNKPDFFPMAAHSHPWGDVLNIPRLVEALAALRGDGVLEKAASSLSVLPATAFGRSLLGIADAAALRALLAAASMSDALLKANNLSDLMDVPAARTALGLGAAAVLGIAGPNSAVTRGADAKIAIGDLPPIPWDRIAAIPALINALANLTGEGLLTNTPAGLALTPKTAFSATLLLAQDAPGARRLLGIGESVVTRGPDGKIAPGDLPALAILDTFEAASDAAMCALNAQKGDLCLRSDLSKTFVLAADPASSRANWKEILAPVGNPITSVFGSTGPAVSVTSLAQRTGAINSSDEFPIYDASTATHRRVSWGAATAGLLTAAYVPPLATASRDGAISAADFTKLQGLRIIALATAAPAPVGALGAVGMDSAAARADHVHAHGDQGGGSLHALATASSAGFMSPAMVAALAAATGVASNALLSITAVRDAGIAVVRTDARNPALAIDAANMASEDGQLAAGNAGFTLFDLARGQPLKIAAGALLSALAARATPADADLLPTGAPAGGLGRTSVAELFTGRTILRPCFVDHTEAKQARQDASGEIALPIGLNAYHLRLTGNATVRLPPARPAAANTWRGISLIVDQDSTGARTLTLLAPTGETLVWPGGTPPDLDLAADGRTRFVFTYIEGETRIDGVKTF